MNVAVPCRQMMGPFACAFCAELLGARIVAARKATQAMASIAFDAIGAAFWTLDSAHDFLLLGDY